MGDADCIRSRRKNGLRQRKELLQPAVFVGRQVFPTQPVNQPRIGLLTECVGQATSMSFSAFLEPSAVEAEVAYHVVGLLGVHGCCPDAAIGQILEQTRGGWIMRCRKEMRIPGMVRIPVPIVLVMTAMIPPTAVARQCQVGAIVGPAWGSAA